MSENRSLRLNFGDATVNLPLAAGSITQWSSISDSGTAWTISQLRNVLRQTVLVITGSEAQAENLKNNLQFFAAPSGQQLPVIRFVDRQTLPYDVLEPQKDLLASRLHALSTISTGQPLIVIVSVPALMYRLPPKRWLMANSLELAVGSELPMPALIGRLRDGGYDRAESVVEANQYTVRGGLIDLWASGCELPIRAEWLDDSIDSLRWFDPVTQRTVNKVQSVSILPGRELALDRTGREQFAASWHSIFPGECDSSPIYRELTDTGVPPGCEYYLPLFFSETDNLSDYLPDSAFCISVCDHLSEAEKFEKYFVQRFEDSGGDVQRPPLPPGKLLISPRQLSEILQSKPLLQFTESANAGAGKGSAVISPLPPVPQKNSLDENLAACIESCDQDQKILFCASSSVKRNQWLELLKAKGHTASEVDSWSEFIDCQSRLAVAVAGFESGLSFPGNLLISARDLVWQSQPAVVPRPPRPRFGSKLPTVKNMDDLRQGDLIVHEEYGIGRFISLTAYGDEAAGEEFVRIEYAGNEYLYLPVNDLDLLHLYSRHGQTEPVLHKLGAKKWQREKKRVREKAEEVAAELLKIQAARMLHPSAAWQIPAAEYAEFVSSFPYPETADQDAVIHEILEDLSTDGSMDRLVCGDVGFGKTEVAMRAIFVAAMNGLQSVVIVPTRLLATQHSDSFRERFLNWPVTIEVLSGSATAKQKASLQRRLASGEIDVLIGTHRLLYGTPEFKNLGLVVIDEEHRFGVRHKEHLKQMRKGVNLLSMTATPIPRTLHMAISDLRSLSLIAMPPEGRLPIRTFVAIPDTSTIRTAIQRELHRGGQIYYVYNRIEALQAKAKQLRQLLPQLRLGIIHGRMISAMQEQIMAAFYSRQIDVLLCTTIVESGLHITNANTIIIERADLLGLAELHQLRGRVGRSDRQAYAWLLIPQSLNNLGTVARQRLEAIARASELGTGFVLASNDLDIRGSGDLLGKAQSGNIQTVGLGYYSELLDKAVRHLRGETEATIETPRVVLNLHIDAMLPESWIPDVNIRLGLYQRLKTAVSPEIVQAMGDELADRFGSLPPPAVNLLILAELRLRLLSLGIRRLTLDGVSGILSFDAKTRVPPQAIVRLLHGDSDLHPLRSLRMRNHLTLGFKVDLEAARQRLEFCVRLIDWLDRASDAGKPPAVDQTVQ